jgi:hypothetical protein
VTEPSQAIFPGAITTPAPLDVPAEDLAALTRPDFPLLSQIACLGQPLIYLDYAATSQKPRQVLEALQHYYGHDNLDRCPTVCVEYRWDDGTSESESYCQTHYG